jgi:hypothetical protein
MNMKVGGRVKIRRNEGLDVFKIVRLEGIVAIIENVITKKRNERLVDDLVVTKRFPTLMVTTWGKDWRQNVFTLLQKEKIDYMVVVKDNSVPITDIYIDAGKVKKAQQLYKEHYNI